MRVLFHFIPHEKQATNIIAHTHTMSVLPRAIIANAIAHKTGPGLIWSKFDLGRLPACSLHCIAAGAIFLFYTIRSIPPVLLHTCFDPEQKIAGFLCVALDRERGHVMSSS